MSKTFIRGLALLEAIDLHGPLTISEIASRTRLDKSIVSRTIAACEADGWVTRTGAKLALGPRAALLGHHSFAAATISDAEPLVHALAGVTGMLAQAYGLVGGRALVLAIAGGRDRSPIATPERVVLPLFATAAGKAVAAQLSPSELDRSLPPEPYPDPGPELAHLAAWHRVVGPILPDRAKPPAASRAVARNRAELDEQLAALRGEGFAVDLGEIHPELGCIAIPWPRPGFPAALACMGSPAALKASAPLVRTALAAAIPGAARPEDIVAAAGRTIRVAG